eukprot:scaffold253204_cov22-Tisochrysis_lutea.AAC.1
MGAGKRQISIQGTTSTVWSCETHLQPPASVCPLPHPQTGAPAWVVRFNLFNSNRSAQQLLAELMACH